MSSRQNSGRDGSSNGNSGQEGLRPRNRRAFGCVTWIYMATLAFLAVASLLLLPFWYFGGWNVFSILEGLAFFGTLLILPAMVLGAVLGLRTYRAERRVATRNGAAVGTLVGWTGYAFLVWLDNVTFRGFGAGAAFYAFVPLALLAAGLVLYALFAVGADPERRRRLVIAGAVVAAVSGLAVLAADFGAIEIMGAFVSTAAGAAGGWVGGIGYARAGGDEMIPPGAAIRRREPRQKRS